MSIQDIENVFCLTDEEIIDSDMDEDEMDEGLAEHEARAQRDAEGLVESNIVAK